MQIDDKSNGKSEIKRPFEIWKRVDRNKYSAEIGAAEILGNVLKWGERMEKNELELRRAKYYDRHQAKSQAERIVVVKNE